MLLSRGQICSRSSQKAILSPYVGSGRWPSAESAPISYFISSEIDADSADGHSRALRVRQRDRPAHNRHRFNTLFQVKMMPIQQDDLASERPCLSNSRPMVLVDNNG